MIGEIVVGLIIFAIAYAWLEFVVDIWTDNFHDRVSQIIGTTGSGIIAFLAILFLVAVIPTTVESYTVSDYKYVKSDSKVAIVWENEHEVSSEAYFNNHIEDSTKVTVEVFNWKNILGEQIGETIDLERKQ